MLSLNNKGGLFFVQKVAFLNNEENFFLLYKRCSFPVIIENESKVCEQMYLNYWVLEFNKES